MDENVGARKEKITYELRKAIRNINRNLHEWRNLKSGKTNFSISYTEVYGVTKNWIVRCLRSVVDACTIDRIFRTGHVYISINESLMCIDGISIKYHDVYRSHYQLAQLISEIVGSMDFKELRYNPNDHVLDDGPVSEFYYPRYEPTNFDVNNYDSLMPKS